MALTPVVNGNTIYSTDINQSIYVLQQASGGQEKGKYYLSNSVYVTGGVMGGYIPSLSRNSTPASLSIDTTDQSPQNTSAGGPFTDHLTANGFHIYTFGTSVSGSCNVGGGYTLNY